MTVSYSSRLETLNLDQLSVAMEQMFSDVATPEEALGAVQTACQDELDNLLNG